MAKKCWKGSRQDWRSNMEKDGRKTTWKIAGNCFWTIQLPNRWFGNLIPFYCLSRIISFWCEKRIRKPENFMKLKHITNNGVSASFKGKLRVAYTSGLPSVATRTKWCGRTWQATPHSVGERPHHTPWEGIQPVELDIYEEIFIKCGTLSHKIPLRTASVLYFELMLHFSWRNFSKSFL